MTRLLLLAAVILTGCSSPCDPQRYRVVLADEMTWWGPTQSIADARARWYCDPSWRRDENIPCLGYCIRNP